MKRIIATLVIAAVSAMSLFADNNVKNVKMNSAAPNIEGKYYINDEDGTGYAKIYKAKDGTYQCQSVDGKPVYDSNGKLKLDVYSQNEEFRKIPVHEAILVFGLKYNPEKKIWEGGKIHHPSKRMLKANCEAYFVGDGKTLCLFGNIAGIGTKRFWTKIE